MSFAKVTTIPMRANEHTLTNDNETGQKLAWMMRSRSYSCTVRSERALKPNFTQQSHPVKMRTGCLIALTSVSIELPM
jgi:hypothetical protein